MTVQSNHPSAAERGPHVSEQSIARGIARESPDGGRGGDGAMRGVIVSGAILLTMGAALLGLRATWRGAVSPSIATDAVLPVIGQVPEFSLTERSGRTVTRADLAGTIWVADFIFTSCSGPCPLLSLRMRSLQQALAREHPDVKLVSVSLDPEFDTLDVLQKYADKHDADPRRWWFLRGGGEKEVHDLVRGGFLQAVARAGSESAIVHSTYFLVIDGSGRIRSARDGTLAETKEAILWDVATLKSEDGA